MTTQKIGFLFSGLLSIQPQQILSIYLPLLIIFPQIGCSPVADSPILHTAEMAGQRHDEPQVDFKQICGNQTVAVTSLTFSDDQHLYSAHGHGLGSVIRLFDIHANNKMLWSSTNNNSVASLLYLPTIGQLIIADVHDLYNFNNNNFLTLNRFFSDSQYAFIGFSNSVAFFANQRGGVLLVDVKSKQTKKIISSDENLNDITAAVYSPIGKFFVVGGAAGVLRRFDLDVDKATLRFTSPIGCPIFSLALSHTREICAVASSDKIIRLFNAENGSLLKKLVIHSSGVDQHLLYLNNPDVLISIEPVGYNCQPSLIRFWNVESGLEIHSPIIGHTSRIVACCLSPDQSLLATGSLDGSIIVWKIPH